MQRYKIANFVWIIQWGTHVPMTKTEHGFEAEVKVPWGRATEYKFLVDGE